MKLLIIGIVLCVLPILTWFGAGFVEAAGTTIFFWVIGIPMILVGADRMKSEGLWATKKKWLNFKLLKEVINNVSHLSRM